MDDQLSTRTAVKLLRGSLFQLNELKKLEFGNLRTNTAQLVVRHCVCVLGCTVSMPALNAAMTAPNADA